LNANPDLPWSEQFRIAARHWVDAEAAASLLEDTKSAFLAQKIAELGDMPYNRAEATVKASAEWGDYVSKMTNARKEANRRKVQCEFLRMKFSEWQSHEASARTEARLVR
jgi:hypothetical protein